MKGERTKLLYNGAVETNKTVRRNGRTLKHAVQSMVTNLQIKEYDGNHSNNVEKEYFSLKS